VETIKNTIHLFGGGFETINILLLFAISLTICSALKNRIIRILFSLLTSVIVVLQLCSLYFVNAFIGYQFYVHFNTRDIIGMIDIYVVQVILLNILLIFLIFLFYSSRAIFSKALLFANKIYPWSKRIFNHTAIYAIKLIVVAISIIIMSFKGGVIYTSFDLITMLNVNEKNFKEALGKAGMEDYVLPGELEVVKGKNIIVISLESLEKGYLSDKMAHLTPNLCSLKNKWTYYNMQQNLGSGWTSGSLYTYLTGFPAYFGVHENSIFQTVYHSNITGISHVFKKAGYNMTYLASDAQYSGTRQMLHAFQIDNIIDEVLLGKYSKDKDLFEKAKLEIQSSLSQKTPFVLFLSTSDTHFPNGIFDERMEEYVPPQESNLEFMVSAVDYMLGDFINYLKRENILSNTIVYIFPDHIKMGNPAIFVGTGKRSLYLLTNAIDSNLTFKKTDTLYQIDLPKIILEGADIKHNAKFLTDYISGDKNKFIQDNVNMLTTLNTSGLLRMYSEPYIPPKISVGYALYQNDTNRYIAHAGGMIDNLTYTNSLEALNVNYTKGFRLFELDIIKTTDGKFVAAHDWEHWAKIANYKGNLPVTNEEFLKHKIFGTYTPMDMKKINTWFKEHKDAILITDKINEPKEFSEIFVDKKRLMMELFSLEAVKEGIEAKIKSSMPAQNVVDALEGDKVEKLKQLGVGNIAVSRRYIAPNIKLLKELKENNIKTYVYHLNIDLGKDENYVVKYELDNIYGIYADNWNFEK